MPVLVAGPAVIAGAGVPPKRIEEFFGRVSSKHQSVSVARMVSPEGWQEPGQRPDFEELTVVLAGMLRVEYASWILQSRLGSSNQAKFWLRSTPMLVGRLFSRERMGRYGPHLGTLAG